RFLDFGQFPSPFRQSDGRGRPSHIVARASPPALSRCERAATGGASASPPSFSRASVTGCETHSGPRPSRRAVCRRRGHIRNVPRSRNHSTSLNFLLFGSIYVENAPD